MTVEVIGTLLFALAISGIVCWQLVSLWVDRTLTPRPDLKASDLNLSISEGELGWHEYQRGQRGDEV